MKLSKYQISKIKKVIAVGYKKSIVLLDVAADKSVSLPDKRSNIYCVDDNYQIIWQVSETKTRVPFENDLFVSLEKNEKDEIISHRFSGFVYRIEPETGEAIQVDFCK